MPKPRNLKEEGKKYIVHSSTRSYRLSRRRNVMDLAYSESCTERMGERRDRRFEADGCKYTALQDHESMRQ